jgi:hypothetical protein
MAKKKKSKLKRFLKKAAPLLAAGLGAAALAKGRNRGSGFLASGAAGGARLPKGDAFARARRLMTTDPAYGNPGYTDAIMRRQALTDNMMTAQDMASDPMFYNASAKKGGRIVKTKGGGKAVRGLGRAFTKGRK